MTMTMTMMNGKAKDNNNNDIKKGGEEDDDVEVWSPFAPSASSIGWTTPTPTTTPTTTPTSESESKLKLKRSLEKKTKKKKKKKQRIPQQQQQQQQQQSKDVEHQIEEEVGTDGDHQVASTSTRTPTNLDDDDDDDITTSATTTTTMKQQHQHPADDDDDDKNDDNNKATPSSIEMLSGHYWNELDGILTIVTPSVATNTSTIAADEFSVPSPCLCLVGTAHVRVLQGSMDVMGYHIMPTKNRTNDDDATAATAAASRMDSRKNDSFITISCPSWCPSMAILPIHYHDDDHDNDNDDTNVVMMDCHNDNDNNENKELDTNKNNHAPDETSTTIMIEIQSTKPNEKTFDLVSSSSSSSSKKVQPPICIPSSWSEACTTILQASQQQQQQQEKDTAKVSSKSHSDVSSTHNDNNNNNASNTPTPTKTLICGAKSTGKSSLMRYLMNRYISSSTSSSSTSSTTVQQQQADPNLMETIGSLTSPTAAITTSTAAPTPSTGPSTATATATAAVLVLDLDVGQPEFTPPGMISLTLVQQGPLHHNHITTTTTITRSTADAAANPANKDDDNHDDNLDDSDASISASLGSCLPVLTTVQSSLLYGSTLMHQHDDHHDDDDDNDGTNIHRHDPQQQQQPSSSLFSSLSTRPFQKTILKAHWFGHVTTRADPTLFLELISDLLQTYQEYIHHNHNKINNCSSSHTTTMDANDITTANATTTATPTTTTTTTTTILQPEQQRQQIPLIINTDGWIKGFGYEILSTLIHRIQPTHVLQLTGTSMGKIFSLDSILQQQEQYSTEGLTIPFKLLSLPAYEATSSSSPMSSATIPGQTLRTIRLCRYFLSNGHDASHNNNNNNNNNSKNSHPSDGWFVTHNGIKDPYGCIANTLAGMKPFCISIHDVSILIDGMPNGTSKNTSPTHIFSTLNGSMVGLCGTSKTINKNKNTTTTTVKYDIPPLLQCYGLGIVRSVDPVRELLYILTPMTPTDLESGMVTTIVQGHIELPTVFLHRGIWAEAFPYMSCCTTTTTITTPIATTTTSTTTTKKASSPPRQQQQQQHYGPMSSSTSLSSSLSQHANQMDTTHTSLMENNNTSTTRSIARTRMTDMTAHVVGKDVMKSRNNITRR